MFSGMLYEVTWDRSLRRQLVFPNMMLSHLDKLDTSIEAPWSTWLNTLLKLSIL